MERTLKIITLEMKKKKFFKNVLIGVIPVFFIVALLLIFMGNNSTDFFLLVIKVVPFIILVNTCYSLTQEFSNKTDKIIFSGIFTRNEIVISKIISFGVISIVCLIASEAVLIVFNLHMGRDILYGLTIKSFFNSLYVFLIYTFTLGSFILFISSCTRNAVATGISTYLLYFDLFLALLKQALFSCKNDIIKCIIKNSPFYAANTGFYVQKYSLNQSIVMIVSGCVFLGLACVVINKRNI